MNFIRQFQVACGNLLHVKMRSLLAVLGIVVGTGAVVALISSSQLATEHALKQFKSLGVNLIAATISEKNMSRKRQAQVQAISLDDMAAVAAASADIDRLAPFTQYYGQIIFRGKALPGGVLGVTSTFPEVVHLQLQQGRFVSDLDENQPFCMIGADLAQQIKKISGHSPVGTQLQIDQTIFTIIGVAKHWKTNLFFNHDLNQSVMVPLPLSMLLNSYVKINNFLVRVKPHAAIDQLQQVMTQLLQQRAPAYRMSYRNPQQLTQVMAKQRQTFSLLLILVGSIALVVGGIGVMNIMLVSVIERKKEIGIRMAVGARARDIRQMFLLESILLTTFGGLLGIVIGLLITWYAAHSNGWDFIIHLFPVFLGFGVSVLVGIVSGIYPAHRASRLDPIVCLRSD